VTKPHSMNSTPGPGIVLFVQYMYMYVYKDLMYPRPVTGEKVKTHTPSPSVCSSASSGTPPSKCRPR